MALQLTTKRTLLSKKFAGAFFAIFALMVQPIVPLNIPSVFALSPLSGETKNLDKANPSYSKIVDTTGLQVIKLSFDYDAKSLDAEDGTVQLVYSAGEKSGTKEIVGLANNNDSEADSVLLEGLAESATLQISISADTSGFESNDKIQLKNITVSGDSMPIVTPELNVENFNTVDGNYKGISVGFNTKNFGTVTDVSVTLERDSGGSVTKTANQGVIDIINNNDSGAQLTTPFVIQEVSFTEASDSFYWQPAPATWDSSTIPTEVTISVTDENDTKTVSNNVFNQGSPSWPTYESLLPEPVPTAVTNTNSGTTYDDLQAAIDDAQTGDTIRLNEDLSVDNDVDVNVRVTIDGNSKTITGEFVKSGNDDNAVLSIFADNVNVHNLTIDGENPVVNQLHGMNIYEATGVSVDNVTARNFRSGLVYNSSTGSVSNVTFSGNIWHDINVDKGTSQPAFVTVLGNNVHNGQVSDIYVDDDTQEVEVVADGYSWARSGKTDYPNDQVYTLKDPDTAAPEVSNVKLNDKTVNIARSKNCGPTDFNLVRGKVSLGATITDESNVASAKYKIRKVTDSGCTLASAYTSNTVTMSNESGENWVTLPGAELDTNNVPEDGNYTIMLTVADEYGNSATEYVDITVDNSAPNVETATLENVNLNSLTSAAMNDDGKLVFTITTDEEILAWKSQAFLMRTTADGGAITLSRVHFETVGEKTYAAYLDLDEGALASAYTENMRIRFTLYDTLQNTTGWTYLKFNSAGNYDDSANIYRFDVDNSKPVASISSPVEGLITNSNTLQVTGVAHDENFDWFKLYIMQATPEKKTKTAAVTEGNLGEPIDISGLADGDYKLRLHVKDKVGNSGDAYVNFTIDRTIPVSTLSSIPNNTGTSRTISGVTDPFATVDVTVHSTPQNKSMEADVSGNWSLLFEGLEVGEHTVNVVITDLAGNITKMESAFTVLATQLSSGGSSENRSSDRNESANPLVQFPTIFTPLATTPFSQGVAPNSPAPEPVAQEGEKTKVFETDETSNEDGDVLGSQDASGTPLSDTAAFGLNAPKLFGLVWFWWIVGIAALIGGWLVIAAAIRRRRGTEL